MSQQSLRMFLSVAFAATLAGCGTNPPARPEAASPKAGQPAAVPTTVEIATKSGAVTGTGSPEVPETSAAAAGSPVPDKAAEPITGAFGLSLGDRFAPAQVAKVVSAQDYHYLDHNNVQRKGTVFRVEPRTPHEAFTSYLMAVTEPGLIYSITGSYGDPEKKSRCDITRRLAAELEQKHGKPTGKTLSDDWSFRDMAVKEYRGVRLYAPHCRSGSYSIIYSDDGAKSATAPSPPLGPNQPGH